MTSGITPVEYQVLIEPIEVQKQTRGGLYIPDQTQEREGFARTEGVLVAKSDRAFEGLVDVPVGARVMYARHTGIQTRGRDGKEYWLVRDKAVLAVVESDDDSTG